MSNEAGVFLTLKEFLVTAAATVGSLVLGWRMYLSDKLHMIQDHEGRVQELEKAQIKREDLDKMQTTITDRMDKLSGEVSAKVAAVHTRVDDLYKSLPKRRGDRSE